MRSTMKNKVGVSQGIPGCQAGASGRTGACCLGLFVPRHSSQPPLTSWLHVAPGNTLLFLEMVSVFGIHKNSPYLLDSPSSLLKCNVTI